MTVLKSVEALISDLMAIHPKGFDLSLGRMKRLLEALGNPQKKMPPVIHVAGTNGKGSTIAFCRAILEASGHRVHVHTSPHLVNWHERFRLAQSGGGKLASDPVLADAISRVSEANGGEPITVFEILSATMFVLFSEHSADHRSWKRALFILPDKFLRDNNSSCRIVPTINPYFVIIAKFFDNLTRLQTFHPAGPNHGFHCGFILPMANFSTCCSNGSNSKRGIGHLVLTDQSRYWQV